MASARLGPSRLVACLLLAAAALATSVAAVRAPEAEPKQAAAAASRWSGVWPSSAPPGNVPSSRAVDGPLLGNGDVGLVAGVKDGVLTFYVSKSDFWHLQPLSTPGHGRVSPEGNTRPRALGGVSISMRNGSSTGAAAATNGTTPAFALRQDIGQGVVSWNMSMGGAPILSGWTTVSQDDGVSRIVFSLSVPSAAVSSAHQPVLSVKTWGVRGGTTEGTAAGGTAWISRRIGGCSNATAAVATSVVGGGTTDEVRVRRGEPTLLVSAVVSSLDLGHRTGPCSWLWRDPVPVAVASAATQNATAVMAVALGSRTFWENFWAKSVISMPSRLEAEHFWFCAQYILGSSSREGRSANGIWGIWVTTDNSAWGGAFTIDYNAEAPFYGVFGANRADIVRPYFRPILEYARQHGGADAAAYSANFSNNCSVDGGVGGMPGVIHMPGVIGQHGFIDHDDMSMHEDASFAVLNFINYWRYTQNATFVREVSYPLVRGVAAWWMCWLRKVDLPSGEYQYNDTHDCTYENCMWCGRDFEPVRKPPNECHTANNVNPASTISFVHFILTHLIELAEEEIVHPPALELSRWRDVLSHLAPIPTGFTNCTGTGVLHPKGHAAFSADLTCTFATAANGTKVLLPQDSPWFFTTRYNPLEFYSIWPGEMIGLGSEPELLRAAQETVVKGDAFAQNNAFCEAFPAAVRIGVNASFVLTQLATLVGTQMPANGYLEEAGGGYETAGASIAVQEMLFQSHEGFLRFFPVVPTGEPASFSGLRAVGAFVVSAKLESNGTVTGIEIVSEAGRNCTMLVPTYPGAAVGTAGVIAVTDSTGESVPTQSVGIGRIKGLQQFATSLGQRYHVRMM